MSEQITCVEFLKNYDPAVADAMEQELKRQR